MTTDTQLGTDYTDGQWHAVSLGIFLHLLVDAGHDPAVLFRVTQDEPVDDSRQFVRHLDVMVVPDGQVVSKIKETGVESIHKVLAKFIERGLVK